MYEKRGKKEFLDQKFLCLFVDFFGKIGEYTFPPLTENLFAKKNSGKTHLIELNGLNELNRPKIDLS